MFVLHVCCRFLRVVLAVGCFSAGLGKISIWESTPKSGLPDPPRPPDLGVNSQIGGSWESGGPDLGVDSQIGGPWRSGRPDLGVDSQIGGGPDCPISGPGPSAGVPRNHFGCKSINIRT